MKISCQFVWEEGSLHEFGLFNSILISQKHPEVDLSQKCSMRQCSISSASKTTCINHQKEVCLVSITSSNDFHCANAS